MCRISVAATESSASSPSAAASDPPSPPDTFKSLPQSPFYGNTLTHWAMSAPTFVPSRNEVWYSDGMYGFYAVRLSGSVWSAAADAAAAEAADAAADQAAANSLLARTGGSEPLLLVAALLVLAVGTARVVATSRRSPLS